MDDALAPTDKLALAMDVIVVLILVVMDDALALMGCCRGINQHVLILVVMDDALAPPSYTICVQSLCWVLILVVMDDALAHSPILRTAFVVRS